MRGEGGGLAVFLVCEQLERQGAVGAEMPPLSIVRRCTLRVWALFFADDSPSLWAGDQLGL